MTDERKVSDSGRDRKAEHIELALDPDVQLRASAFDDWQLTHQALPEIARDSIDTRARFLGRELELPLLISCMTGGTAEAQRINANLAIAAEAAGVALGVGSQRKAIEAPALAATFEVRRYAPSVPIIANLGAVQLNYGFGLDECRRAVEMVDADALALHLNPLQEALQPEGQGDFANLAPKIGDIVARLEVPVIVKEIGCGLSAESARRLAQVGVELFDSAGLGGTSWSRIEGARAGDRELGELFADWGVATPDSIVALRRLGDGVVVIGSGGVRSGVDVAKAVALGADLVGIAGPFLEAAVDSAARVGELIERTATELEISMFCCGAPDLEALRRVEIERRPGGRDRLPGRGPTRRGRDS